MRTAYSTIRWSKTWSAGRLKLLCSLPACLLYRSTESKRLTAVYQPASPPPFANLLLVHNSLLCQPACFTGPTKPKQLRGGFSAPRFAGRAISMRPSGLPWAGALGSWKSWAPGWIPARTACRGSSRDRSTKSICRTARRRKSTISSRLWAGCLRTSPISDQFRISNPGAGLCSDRFRPFCSAGSAGDSIPP